MFFLILVHGFILCDMIYVFTRPWWFMFQHAGGGSCSCFFHFFMFMAIHVFFNHGNGVSMRMVVHVFTMFMLVYTFFMLIFVFNLYML